MTAGDSSTTSSSPSQTSVSVLFVCLGNICRSPMAEAVFRYHTHNLSSSTSNPHPQILTIDSCGTGAYHTGDLPDPRTIATLKNNGIKGYKHAARKFDTRDFERFDYIFAMDSDNLSHLKRLRERVVKSAGGEEEGVGKVMLFGEFAGERKKKRGEEVGDPYYGGSDGFDIAYEQVTRFSKNFLEALEAGELA